MKPSVMGALGTRDNEVTGFEGSGVGGIDLTDDLLSRVST